MPKNSTHELLKKRYTEASDAYKKQAKREEDDLRFQIPEMQWDEEARKFRENNADGTPPRPCISVPKLTQPIDLILNQQMAAHLGFNVHPESPDADEDMAEIYGSLLRAIDRNSRAHLARAWAYSRAVMAGRGAYRIVSEWDPTSDHPFDQRIRVKRILHQENVLWDPAATEPDYSDARYAFVVDWIPQDVFESEYPNATSGDDALFEQEPAWVRSSDGKNDVAVVEYFYRTYDEYDVCLLEDETIMRADEWEAVSAPKPAIKARRTVKRPVLMWAKATGAEILEEQEWNGSLIPIIEVFGKELQPIKGERHWEGVIRPGKGAQQSYNFAVSTIVEIVALEPKAPFIATPEQLEGHEAMWATSNQRTWPYLLYNSIGQLGPPQRVQVDSNRLQMAAMLANQANADVQSATAQFDPSLGRSFGKEQSGKAIQALQGQGQGATSNYLQNLANISMAYEARVIMDMIPHIYDRPGRVIPVLDVDDDTEHVMIGQPYIIDPRTKKPRGINPMLLKVDKTGAFVEPPQLTEQGEMILREELGLLPPPQSGAEQPGMGGPEMGPGAAPEMPQLGMPQDAMAGQPPMPPAPMPPSPQDLPELPEVHYYDLSKGQYTVVVDIGKSQQTLQQDAADEIGQTLMAQPQLMTLIGDIYYRFRDFSGAREIAERIKLLQEHQMPWIHEKGGAADPQKLRAENQALNQQVQQLQQIIEEGKKMLEGEQLKQQAQLQKANIDAASRERIAGLEAQTKFAIERLRMVEEELRRSHEARQAEFAAAHETALQGQKAAGDAIAAQFGKPPQNAAGIPLEPPSELQL